MSVWFEGKNDIECDLGDVKHSFEALGNHYVGVIGRIPGLTSVELLDQTSDAGVTHRSVISDLAAPGFLGFFYRKFGSSKMGNAFLTAYASYFEKPKG